MHAVLHTSQYNQFHKLYSERHRFLPEPAVHSVPVRRSGDSEAGRAEVCEGVERLPARQVHQGNQGTQGLFVEKKKLINFVCCYEII